MESAQDHKGKTLMRILIAIDGSEQSEAAIDEIAHRLSPPEGEVRIVSVVEPFPTTYLPGDGVDMNVYDQMEKDTGEVARATVEKAAAKLRAGDESSKFRVTTKVLSGSPKVVILEEAEAFGADLIIVGSHGHGAVERFLLGSVSQAVALHARCSVEIVRGPKSGEMMRILLATDGSGHSEAAVAEITRWHYPADSVVQVISVVEPPYFPTTYPLGGVDMEVYDQLEKAAREAAEKAAAKLRAGDESSKFSVTTKVLSGSPKLVILEEAEAFGADLIVVGSHGHGAFERFLLGSVSQAVALHAKCSVEIVRTPKSGQK